jgi:hypothetical protein
MASLKGLFEKEQLPMKEMFEIRMDIERALYAAGFSVIGAGTSDGEADIRVERNGHSFFVDIKNLV